MILPFSRIVNEALANSGPSGQRIANGSLMVLRSVADYNQGVRDLRELDLQLRLLIQYQLGYAPSDRKTRHSRGYTQIPENCDLNILREVIEDESHNLVVMANEAATRMLDNED